MSRAAWELKCDIPQNEWLKKTRIEHWEPIAQLWSWMVRDSPSREDLLARMRKWPIVTVTEDEEKQLQNYHDPEARYRMAGIEVGRAENGNWTSLPLPAGKARPSL